MSEYDFFISHLRFVANRTERSSSEITEMMDALVDFADAVERSPEFDVAADQTAVTGRALAGLAGFLQQHILPEVVNAGNSAAEKQVRWVIDTSMGLTATLTVHGETEVASVPCPISLPPAP